jgi:hypothetical protein
MSIEENTNPLSVIERADGLIEYKGRSQELAPLNLRDEPELHAVVATVAEHLGWKV